jgi:hypothetical protein
MEEIKNEGLKNKFFTDKDIKKNKDLNNEYKKLLSIHDNKVNYQTKIIENILSIEEYLLNKLLPKLYDNNLLNDKNIFNYSRIFTLICLTIINYREYFYLKKIFGDFFKKYYIDNILNYHEYIIYYLNEFKIPFNKIKIIIELYFKNVFDSIDFLDSFTYTYTYKKDKNICTCENYIKKNIISFNDTKIFLVLKDDNKKHLIESPKFPLQQINVNEKKKILYHLKQNFNLKVLYNFKNNNHSNNIDNIMMLINCYIILNMIDQLDNTNFTNIYKNDFNYTYGEILKDLYVENLLIKKQQNGGSGSEKVNNSEEFKVMQKCIDIYDCDIIKYKILKIFITLTNIFKKNNISNNEKNTFFTQYKTSIINYLNFYFSNNKELIIDVLIKHC